MLTIRRLSPDDPQLHDWYAVVREAHLSGREAAWWESWEVTRTYLSRPAERAERVVVAATDGEEVVGGAEVVLPLVDDVETVSVTLGVAPAHRRRGVGDLLVADLRTLARERGRSILQAEVNVPTGQDFESSCGGAFARRHGLRSVSSEDRLVVDLPYDERRLRRMAERVPVPAGYRFESFVGACPEHLLAEWARMGTQMNEDVPTGELTRSASVIDVERVRTSDRRMDEQGWTKVRTAVLTDDGVGAGYTGDLRVGA